MTLSRIWTPRLKFNKLLALAAPRVGLSGSLSLPGFCGLIAIPIHNHLIYFNRVLISVIIGISLLLHYNGIASYCNI